MAYKISDVSKKDFPELVRCMWDSYEQPPQHLYYIFCPLNAGGAASREEAIQESIDRFWEWKESDSSYHWQQVVETKTGKIVGGALWKINRTNPYADAHGEDEDAYWHPEGGQREFANQVIESHEAARAEMARRPHVYLNIIFTHPEYQRTGVGSLMLEWGVQKAAELDVEMWLSAWSFGRPLYEKFGFTTVEHHITKPNTDNPDEAWKRSEREWTNLEEWVMWRPKGGPYEEGKSVKPWLEEK